MAKNQMSKKVKDNSIAGRIKGAMVKSSVICLAALGLVSLICISLATRAMIKSDMTEMAKISATLVGAEIQKMKDITYEMG